MRPPAARLASSLALLASLAASQVLPGCRSREPGCPAGQTDCGLGCVDPSTSAAHCGGCNQPCGLGTCAGGACQCDAVAGLCPDGVYPRCADTQHDPARCGAGCLACNPGATCVLGACACPAGTTDCLDACVDTATDPRHCGGCGIPCGGGRTCEGGQCLCQAPRQDCGAAGCFDHLTDERHCGTACGDVVSCPANATCVAGACDCPGSQAICGNACADLATDEANCGLCGRSCISGAVCASSTCSCPASLPNQCPSPDRCVAFGSDEANCGGCGLACSAGTSCVAGRCACRVGQTACGATGTCCDGGCCPDGACRIGHDNGLTAAPYFTCDPLATYDLDAARAAADSWSPAASQDLAQFCSGSCLCRRTNTQAATWCYDGPLQGQVGLDTLGPVCQCPGVAQTTTNWD